MNNVIIENKTKISGFILWFWNAILMSYAFSIYHRGYYCVAIELMRQLLEIKCCRRPVTIYIAITFKNVE